MDNLLKVGFFQILKSTANGVQYIEKSSTRLMCFLAFFCLSLPGTFIVLLDARVMFVKMGFTWQQLIYSATMIVILNLLWIAPKAIAKMAENGGLINKIIDKSK
jgi:hypothetical protein